MRLFSPRLRLELFYDGYVSNVFSVSGLKQIPQAVCCLGVSVFIKLEVKWTVRPARWCYVNRGTLRDERYRVSLG